MSHPRELADRLHELFSTDAKADPDIRPTSAATGASRA